MSLSEVVLNSPVAVRHRRLPAKLFPVNSHVENILSLPSLKRASRDLQASRGPGKPPGASKALEEYLPLEEKELVFKGGDYIHPCSTGEVGNSESGAKRNAVFKMGSSSYKANHRLAVFKVEPCS